MNYLSHYYFAVDLEKPLYCLGLIYPDLNSKWKDIPLLPDLLRQGCEEHAALDYTFHNWWWFKSACRDLNQQFDMITLGEHALVHCAVEIAIDFYVCDEMKKQIPGIYASLESPAVEEWFEQNEQGKDTIKRLIEENRFEAYGTKEGGIKALKRALGAIQKFGVLRAEPDLSKLYDESHYEAQGFMRAKEELLNLFLKELV